MMLSAEDALSFVADLDERAFLASDLHQSAVIRKLEVMGEAAGKVSQSFCAAHEEIPWKEMTGLRHRLIHGYGDVRVDIVWRVVTETLPGLIANLRPLIPPEAVHEDD
ncbi:MAG: HepT-like ribonuclease domain-containing protein [Stellaceae bacterium]